MAIFEKLYTALAPRFHSFALYLSKKTGESFVVHKKILHMGDSVLTIRFCASSKGPTDKVLPEYYVRIDASMGLNQLDCTSGFKSGTGGEPIKSKGFKGIHLSQVTPQEMFGWVGSGQKAKLNELTGALASIVGLATKHAATLTKLAALGYGMKKVSDFGKSRQGHSTHSRDFNSNERWGRGGGNRWDRHRQKSWTSRHRDESTQKIQNEDDSEQVVDPDSIPTPNLDQTHHSAVRLPPPGVNPKARPPVDPEANPTTGVPQESIGYFKRKK